MIKFDSRDIKPRLYNVAILSIVVFFVIAIVLRVKGMGCVPIISLILTVYLITVIAMLVHAFIGQLEYNPYSYNTIYYAGFALFLTSVLSTQGWILIKQFTQPAIFNLHFIFLTLLNSAQTYMLYSFPFILIFSVALCISNIALIRHEGKRFVNYLGIILSLLLLLGEVIIFVFHNYINGNPAPSQIHALCGNLFSAVYLYFLCMLVGAILANSLVADYDPDPDKDFLIVLGCGIRQDGRPKPLLKGRLDRALKFYEKQKNETGKDLIFVTSGGQGPDEPISESESMKRYLMENGIEEKYIIKEDRSTDTFENMKYSKEKIWEINPEGKIAFSTTNYHVFRSGIFARRVKMRALGMGAPTKWYFWPNASVREFVGVLTKHKGKQTLVFCGMLAFYSILTMIVY